MLTQAEENYLKEIYALEELAQKEVSTNAIAEKMQTKASSVTDMLQKLSHKGLVAYKKYNGSRLSEKGREKAVLIIRKHRLWETFLVEKLDFPWDEVHEIAEQLEHIKSPKLTDRLDAFLGYPELDPHGDPIPNSDGEIVKVKNSCLADLGIDDWGILVGVKNSSDDFLKYLNKKNIAIGDKIKVTEIEPFDNSIKIIIKAMEMVISEDIAKNLYLRTK